MISYFTDSSMTALLELLLMAQESLDEQLDIKLIYQRKINYDADILLFLQPQTSLSMLYSHSR